MQLKFQNLPIFCWIVSYMLDAAPVSAAIYQLPVLPGLPYSLHDIMILPWHGNHINVSLSTNDIARVLEPLTLTDEDGFRLNSMNFSNHLEVENGIHITTLDKATVTISLPIGQLLIPSIDMCSEHYAFDKITISPRKVDFVLIQPIQNQTFANICSTEVVDEKNDIDNSEIKSDRINTVLTNCTQRETIYPSGLILERVSSFHRLEINTNQATCVFQGYTTNSSFLLTNRKDYNNSLTTMQPIKWSFASPIRETSNQFVFIPTHVGREANLYILSSTDTNVSISTEGNVTQYAATPNTWLSVDIYVQEEHATTVSSNNPVSLSCSYNTTDDDICHIVPQQDFTLDLPNLTWSSNYTWIYYTSDLVVTVLCQGPVLFNLANDNQSAEIRETRRVYVFEQMYQVLFVYDIIPGLYKLSLNCSSNRCTVKYSNRENYQSKQEDNVHEHEEFYDFPNTTKSSDVLVSAEITDLINISKNIKTTVESTTLRKVNQTSTIEDSKSQLENSSQTKNATGLENSHKEFVNINVKPIKNDVNDRFKVVVDILHSKDGHINILPSSSDSETSKYVYTDEFSGYMGVSDNKSFTAIFASLGAALLAVIILILGFLLKEIFSRRQQRRNTRIRPFVSYY